MKKVITFLSLLLVTAFINTQAQTMIDNFDNSVRDTVYFTNMESTSALTIADNHTNFKEGTGAIDFNAKIANIHSWGTFCSIIHNVPFTKAVNWTSSKNDTLYLWLKVRSAPGNAANMFFRIQIGDQLTTGGTIEEYIYENATALDVVRDWFLVKVPFNERVAGPNPDSTGFILAPTSWGMPKNNSVFDFDKIVQFSLIAVTGGGIADSVKVSFDNFYRGPLSNVPVELTFFSAKKVNNSVYLTWSTATEANNRGFEVERKLDNGFFESIDFVNGVGSTLKTQTYNFKDDINNVRASKIEYRLKQYDFNGSFNYSSTVLVDNSISASFELSQNYPNPFNPSTVISYQVPTDSKVTLKLFNILGNEVSTLVNEVKAAGKYDVNFNASKLTSGIYFYTITAGNFSATKKMALVK